MTTFFSFLKTHKLPPKSILHKLLARPLTWYGITLYALFGSVLIVAYILILHLNNQLLVTVPARGGTVTEGVIGAPHVINPILATTQTDMGLSDLVYSGLLKKESDGTYSPDLAAGYSVSPDGLTYTFTLKPNLKWSDGKLLESSDIAFTVTKLADETLHGDSIWQSVTVSTPDPHTVIFTLSAPQSDFLDDTTIGIIPEHIWSTISDDNFESAKENTHPVGSGPFKVQKIKYQGSVPTQILLKRNPHYALTAPYIDHYDVTFFANQQDLLSALHAGAIDITMAADPAIAANFRHKNFTSEKVATSTIVGLFRLQNSTTLSDNFLGVIDSAIDKNAILATVENGYGILPDEAIAPVPTADTLATLQTIGFTSNGGTLEKNNAPVTFSLAVENDPRLLLAADTLRDQLATLGITVTVNAFDPGTFQTVLRTNQYPLFLGSIRNSDIPSGYEPALILYTIAYPLIHDTTLHTVIPTYLDALDDRYAHVEEWYARTDTVWKFFQKNNN